MSTTHSARWLARGIVPAVLLTLAVLVPASPAIAATINVTTTVDEYDENPGACSLREAAVSANEDIAFGGCASGSGEDVISVPAGRYVLTRIGTDENASLDGDIDFDDLDGDEFDDGSVIVQGAGMGATIIDGNGFVTGERVFQVREDNATFADLTVRNGNGNRGGGIFAHTEGVVSILRSSIHSNTSAFNGGGVTATNGATLNVIDSEIANNVAPEGGVGGGIYVSNEGEEVLVRNSTIDENSAYYAGGGIYVGGGVPTLIENSTVSGNSTRDQSEGAGGGIYIEPPFEFNNVRGETTAQPPFTSLILKTTVNGNTAAGVGGGVFVGCCGLMDIFESTISNNGAQYGGGIFNVTGVDGGDTLMENVTVSSNYAHFDGGGIYNIGELNMHHTTVYRNEAQPSGTGGGIYDDSSVNTLTYANSIIAKNTYDDCGGNEESHGYNVLGDNSCDSDGSTDISPDNGDPVDPGLAPLRHNGGPTRTHELLPGSPAIDEALGGESCPPTDQRGLGRPTGAECDIGAYEVGSFPEVGGEVVTRDFRCRGLDATIVGTSGPDVLVGTSGPDVIQGLEGFDTIRGKGGDDVICGARGDDLMKGGRGDDILKGHRGNDRYRAGKGNDLCVPGPGKNDTYRGCERPPQTV